MQDIILSISGMSCGHCLNAVNRAISSVAGVEVKSVRVGRAELRVPAPAAVDALKTAIEDAGYKVDGVVG